MSQQTPIVTFSPGLECVPAYRPDLARELPISLAPSTTFVAGLVLGQITSAASDVQTITAPGSGTYTLSGVNPITGVAFSTTALAAAASDATVQAAIIAALGTGITVASLAVTFGGQFASMPVQLMTTTAGSVAHTTIGRTAKTFTTYASGNSDGSQVAKCILRKPVTTDSMGNITSNPMLPGESLPYATAWFTGWFNCADLTGLDTNAVTNLAGRLAAGTVSAGTLIF